MQWMTALDSWLTVKERKHWTEKNFHIQSTAMSKKRLSKCLFKDYYRMVPKFMVWLRGFYGHAACVTIKYPQETHRVHYCLSDPQGIDCFLVN